MYTKREALDLLLKARNLLHKQENGETVTSLDITLAHDCVDMVIDAIVQNNIGFDNNLLAKPDWADAEEEAAKHGYGLDEYPLWEQNLEAEIQGLNDR